ncbi:MAG: hypothetical protein JEZ02_06570 [Desulfatibacillum sp.]|nr:hypothetical protein [Desulfatibacillum sp.]
MEDREEYRQEAIVRFRRGAIVLALFFGIHCLTGANRTFAISWVYWIPTPYFLLGCYYMAKAKGYSTRLCLLGVANLLGVFVMFMLPDKSPSAKPDNFFNRDRQLGVVCLAVVLVFPVALLIGTLRVNAHLDRYSAYRAKLIDPQTQIPLDDLVAELEDFLDEGVSVQTLTKPGSEESLNVADSLLGAMECFFIHVQRNQSLQSKNKEGVAPEYTDGELSGLKYKIIQSFEKKIGEERTHAAAGTYRRWLQMAHYPLTRAKESPLVDFMKELDNTLVILNEQLAIYMEENFLCPPIHSDQIFNAENYTTFPKEQKCVSKETLEELVTISVDENAFIVLTIKDTPKTLEDLVGQTIMFVPAVKKEFDRNGNEQHKYSIKRVGGTLRDTYLANRNVLCQATENSIYFGDTR